MKPNRDNQAPTVSVVIPVRNEQRYVAEALDSILKQTFDDFEVIVIDDASDDETPQILANYTDPRVRIKTNPQAMGVGGALNAGLALARGTYIARMDADDIAKPQRLEKQVAFLERHPDIGLVSSNTCIIDENGTLQEEIYPGRGFAPAALRWELFWSFPIVHPTVMMRADLLKSVGGYPPNRVAEDYALWMTLRNVTNFQVLDAVHLSYRRHSNRVTDTNRSPLTTCMLRSTRETLEQFVSDVPPDSVLMLAKRMRPDAPTNEEIHACCSLLIQVYRAMRAKENFSGKDLEQIRHLAGDRLISILERYKSMDRRTRLMVYRHLFQMRPEPDLVRRSIKDVSRTLLGERIWRLLRIVLKRNRPDPP